MQFVRRYILHKGAALVAGPALFVLMNSLHPAGGMEAQAWRTASVGVWMALWWATEAVPVAVTAFLPLVLFAPLGVTPIREAAAPFANPIIYLFLGGFLMALAVEHSGLHRRIALLVLSRTGTEGRRLVAGFMLTGMLLSMWMTNTSTTMVLLPICLSVIRTVAGATDAAHKTHLHNFQTALLIGMAYSTTIGGLATLIGTPPNGVLAAFMQDQYGLQIDFVGWMLAALPLSIIMLPLTWWLLVRVVFPFTLPETPQAQQRLRTMAAELGPITKAETRVALLFGAVITLWIFRRPLNALLVELELLEKAPLSDAGIVMAAAVLLFVIPRGKNGKDNSTTPLLTWEQAVRLPWGVLLLFGGGLSLAAAVSDSGLALWLGQQLQPLGALGILPLVLGATLLVIFLTEMTSNTATTATLLPVVAALAAALALAPLTLAVPVALAASCAFMLPVATPPNAIVFASGMVSIPQMVRAGLLLNLCGAVLVLLVALYWAPLVLG